MVSNLLSETIFLCRAFAFGYFRPGNAVLSRFLLDLAVMLALSLGGTFGFFLVFFDGGIQVVLLL
jgi:hypothetical protein